MVTLIGIFVFACCGEFLNKAKFVSENLYVQDSVRIFAAKIIII